MYGACATMGLVINAASMLIENHCIHNANCFVCSHNATAERQFRYPIEYGVQRKETMTTTATGAVSVILDNNPSAVRIEALTIGRVIDMNQSDPNDMGRAMAPAAFALFGGIAATAIIYFMLIKGLKDSSFMTSENKHLIH